MFEINYTLYRYKVEIVSRSSRQFWIFPECVWKHCPNIDTLYTLDFKKSICSWQKCSLSIHTFKWPFPWCGSVHSLLLIALWITLDSRVYGRVEWLSKREVGGTVTNLGLRTDVQSWTSWADVGILVEKEFRPADLFKYSPFEASTLPTDSKKLFQSRVSRLEEKDERWGVRIYSLLKSVEDLTTFKRNGFNIYHIYSNNPLLSINII